MPTLSSAIKRTCCMPASFPGQRGWRLRLHCPSSSPDKRRRETVIPVQHLLDDSIQGLLVEFQACQTMRMKQLRKVIFCEDGFGAPGVIPRIVLHGKQQDEDRKTIRGRAWVASQWFQVFRRRFARRERLGSPSQHTAERTELVAAV